MRGFADSSTDLNTCRGVPGGAGGGTATATGEAGQGPGHWAPTVPTPTAPSPGRGVRQVASDLLVSSAAGGARRPVTVRCPSLPFPLNEGGRGRGAGRPARAGRDVPEREKKRKDSGRPNFQGEKKRPSRPPNAGGWHVAGGGCVVNRQRSAANRQRLASNRRQLAGNRPPGGACAPQQKTKRRNCWRPEGTSRGRRWGRAAPATHSVRACRALKAADSSLAFFVSPGSPMKLQRSPSRRVTCTDACHTRPTRCDV